MYQSTWDAAQQHQHVEAYIYLPRPPFFQPVDPYPMHVSPHLTQPDIEPNLSPKLNLNFYHPSPTKTHEPT
jgi:hypothetical protein